jgi:DNA-binding LacI/PurR family transcriptional regulator
VIDIHAEQVGRQAVDQALWRREHRNEPHVVRLVTPRLMLPDQCE